MPPHRNSAIAVLFTAGVVAGCSDSPTEPRPVEEAVPASAPMLAAYSADDFATVRAALEDVSVRVVSGISNDSTASVVRAALATLNEQVESNSPLLIRRAIGDVVRVIEVMGTSESAREYAAELESVRLVLTSATELLPKESK